ncbi:MAG: S41 family peptidase, partial [Rhodospirillales bacterium]
EKYIHPVAVEDIAIEGMRGLGAIDPNLTVSRDGGDVTLAAAGLEVARLPTPEAGDVAGWAKLTVDVSMAAREASAGIRAADMEDLYEAVFDGVLSNLDIFSRYAGADEARRNRSKRDGFGGIGIRYRLEDGEPLIFDVIPNTPAAKAGLRKDDRITHADGQALKGLSKAEIGRRLRGPTYTRIELTIRRPGAPAPLTFAMDRAHIFATTVFETRKDGIVVLRVRSFNQDTARALAEALEKTRDVLGDDMKGLVLDLRGNPGGLLKQAVKVADLLLTQGHIISTRGRHADSIHHYEAGGRDLAFSLPVVVLVDGKSASAAEIVAAALQDRQRAVVIGTASFGKGSVQTVIRLPNDGEITLTWSRLVAPSGYMLHGLGVLPAICTSGLGNMGAEVIAAVLANRTKTEETLYAWRTPGLQDEAKRRHLRESCPSQRRRDVVEVEIARRLIEDKALYARALTLSSATHEARY